MNPIFRKVKNEEEKTALLRQARAIYDAVPFEHQHLFARSDEDFLSTVSENIEVIPSTYTPPRDLTASELDAQNARLNVLAVFGNRETDSTSWDMPPALKQFHADRDAAEFSKLVAPARRAETVLENAIREAMTKVLAKGAVGVNEHDRSRFAITPFTKRASGERIEFDARLGESTLYVDGAYKGFWKGSPADRPSAAV
jgi:hypothetical protein